MSVEKYIYTNLGEDKHTGWVDSMGKEWDSHTRAQSLMERILQSNNNYRIFAPERLDEPEILSLLSRIHKPEMIASIRDASLACIDGEAKFTNFDLNRSEKTSPIDRFTYGSAMRAVNAAKSAARSLLDGSTRLSLSISRPPGHHAGKDFYHGFCYFNAAGVATEILKDGRNKVAILDIDAHHGDGTQNIFYDDPDVMYASIHADPKQVFPHTGDPSEVGAGQGVNTKVNIPFDMGISSAKYKEIIAYAMTRIKKFNAQYLVISAGFDTHSEEFPGLPPITQLKSDDYFSLGMQAGGIHLPTCILLEGGYNHNSLADSYVNFLKGVEDELSCAMYLYNDHPIQQM